MVLASTRSGMPINKLAQLAVKITEVAILEIADVSVQPSSSELESRNHLPQAKDYLSKKASRHACSSYHRHLTNPVSII